MKKFILSLIVIMVSLGFSLNIVEPLSKTINQGEVIQLGPIGPGQTVFISINPEVTTGGKFGFGGQYDIASVVSTPKNWKYKDSKINGKPLQIEITADKFAEDGSYLSKIKVADEDGGEKLEDFIFNVNVTINRDVMGVSIEPKKVSVGPGQPARYAITVTNKGTTSDVFEVNSTGVGKWGFKKFVYVPPKSTKMFYYEITENEEETYTPTIKVTSTSSPLIHSEEKVTFSVSSDLFSDYKATNHGTLVFPLFEMPIYALSGLISNLFQ